MGRKHIPGNCSGKDKIVLTEVAEALENVLRNDTTTDSLLTDATYHNTRLLLRTYRRLYIDRRNTKKYVSKYMRTHGMTIEDIEVVSSEHHHAHVTAIGLELDLANNVEGALIKFMTRALRRVKRMCKNGERSYQLLYYIYFAPESCTATEAEEMFEEKLKISASTYHRWLQQAITDYAQCLFGFPGTETELMVSVVSEMYRLRCPETKTSADL